MTTAGVSPQVPTPTSTGPVPGATRRAVEPPAPSLFELLGTSGLAQLALLSGGVLFVWWAQFQRMVHYWIKNPDWSHGFLIPLFSLYFIHSRRRELAATPRQPSWAGLPIVLLAVGTYLYCIRIKFGYPQALSIVVVIAGLVLLCCGWRQAVRLAFPVGFLVLALPPPEYIYRQITQPLQQIAAFFGDHLLRLLPNVLIDRNGVNIAYEHISTGRAGAFTVAGACSGMRSLMAFVALGLAMAYFTPRPVWHRILIALVVVPVALFCNVIRVVVTGGLNIFGYEDWAKGSAHSLLGIGTFALGFAIYFGLLFVLDHLYVADDAADAEATT